MKSEEGIALPGTHSQCIPGVPGVEGAEGMEKDEVFDLKEKEN